MRGDANARDGTHASSDMHRSSPKTEDVYSALYTTLAKNARSQVGLADVLHLESNQSFTPGIGRDKTPLADATTICHASGAPVLWCTNPRRVLLLLLLLLLLL